MSNPASTSTAASMTEVARSTIHKGKKFDLEKLTLRNAKGHLIERECIRHPGAVVLLPLLDRPAAQGGPAIVFVRNERFSVGRTILELPAGTREPGERPDLTAGRELIEETGYRAATITPLTRFYTTPGMTDELMWAYLATGLTHVGQALEEDEVLTPELVPVADAVRMAEKGELEDGKSILSILLARATGLI